MSEARQRIRARFRKGERVRHISHLDVLRYWERAIRRAGLPLLYSQGFTPHPKIAFAAPLPLGFIGEGEIMEVLLEELKGRGLAFLDSRTTAASVGEAVAMRHGLPFAARDVFLDHDLDAGAIAKQLVRLEKIARGRGSAIAIGHPRRATLDVLGEWLETLDERGLVLVPVSAIIKRRAGG